MDNITGKALIDAIKVGKIKICPSCGKQNSIENDFCEACGRRLKGQDEVQKVAFKSVTEDENREADKIKDIKVQFMAPIEIDEQHNAFAEGLPDWSVEPPQVVVRRTKN